MSNFPAKAKQMKILFTLLFTAALAACAFAQDSARQAQSAQRNPQCQCQAAAPACCACCACRAASRPNAPSDDKAGAKEKSAQSAAADSAKDNSKSASGATASGGQKGKAASSARRQNSGTRKNIQRDEL